VLLGIGTDGHFASLFPGLPETKAGLDLRSPALCVAVDKQQNGYARLSLTITALLHTRLILVAISGRPKRAIALQALAGTSDTPIAALLSHRKDDLEFLWTE
jgi:6-phosphogluconolactonase